jgi:hypothetical protein
MLQPLSQHLLPLGWKPFERRIILQRSLLLARRQILISSQPVARVSAHLRARLLGASLGRTLLIPWLRLPLLALPCRRSVWKRQCDRNHRAR